MPDPVRFGAGLEVRIEQPAPPVFRTSPPVPATVTVVPVAGPPGPRGHPGPAIAVLDDLSDVDAATAPTGVPLVLWRDPSTDVYHLVLNEVGQPQLYEHQQTVAADTWVVDHDLGRHPIAWSLYDDQGRLCDEYVVDHPTVNRVVVRMDVATAGRIRLI